MARRELPYDIDDVDGTIDKDKVGLLNGTCAGDIDRLTTYAAWYMCW